MGSQKTAWGTGAAVSCVFRDYRPDPEPKPADAKHLEGQEVVIHGLKGRPELNGQRGRALKWNSETRRIGVEVEGMGKLSVKADNVRLPNA